MGQVTRLTSADSSERLIKIMTTRERLPTDIMLYIYKETIKAERARERAESDI